MSQEREVINEELDFSSLKYDSYVQPPKNPKKKNSNSQKGGPDSRNNSREFPVPTIDKHSNECVEGKEDSYLDKLDFKALGYGSKEPPKFNPVKKKPDWLELDTQKAMDEALAQRFVEQTMSAGVQGVARPLGGMLRHAPLGGYEIVPNPQKHKKHKKLKEDRNITYKEVNTITLKSLMEEASNPGTDIQRLEELSQHKNEKIRQLVYKNPIIKGKIVKPEGLSGLKSLNEEVAGDFFNKKSSSEKCDCSCHGVLNNNGVPVYPRVHCWGPHCCGNTFVRDPKEMKFSRF